MSNPYPGCKVVLVPFTERNYARLKAAAEREKMSARDFLAEAGIIAVRQSERAERLKGTQPHVEEHDR